MKTPLPRHLALLLTLLSLLCAGFLQGLPYVRCSLDGTLHFVACCQAAHWEDGQAFDEPSCCEHLERPDLAPATSSPAPVPRMPLLAVVPPSWPAVVVRWRLLRVAPPAPVAERPPVRAGPEPPSMGRRLARLSRLLT
jgi:hypothetical protein